MKKLNKIITIIVVQIFIYPILLLANPQLVEQEYLSPSLQISVPNFRTAFDDYRSNNSAKTDFPSLDEQKQIQRELAQKIITAIDKSDRFLDEDLVIVKKVINIAESVYKEQTFTSEPAEYYLHHTLEVAETLLKGDLKLNPSIEVVCAAILHRMSDARIWQSAEEADIKVVLIDEIVALKNKFLKIAEFSYAEMNLQEQHGIQNFMNVIIQKSAIETDGKADPRIIKLVLADKLASIRFASEIDRDDLVKEITDIYAPLAHRIGGVKLKDLLLNESFRLSNPFEYKKTLDLIKVLLNKDYFELETELSKLQDRLNETIKSTFGNTFKVDVSVRVKGLYEIYEKFRDREMLNDLLGIRIICDCPAEELYQFSDVIENIVGRWGSKEYDSKRYDFKLKQGGAIYIDINSSDSYDGNPYEVQILSRKSYEQREREFPHWSYKLAQRTGQIFDAEEYVPIEDFDLDFKRVFDSLKENIFAFALLPNNENTGMRFSTKRLPPGAVPADLAASRLVNLLNDDYKGAAVRGWDKGRLTDTHGVGMDYVINPGDILEVISAKNYLKADRTKRTNLKKLVRGVRTQLLLALMDLGVNPDYTKTTSGEKSLKKEFELMGVKITPRSKVVQEFLNPFARSMGFIDVRELYLALTYYSQKVSVGEVVEFAKESGEKIIQDNFTLDDFALGQLAQAFNIESKEVFFIRVGAREITKEDIKEKIKEIKRDSSMNSDIKNVRLNKEYKFTVLISRNTIKRNPQPMLTAIVNNINQVVKSLDLKVTQGKVRNPVLKAGNAPIQIEFSVLNDDVAKINLLKEKLDQANKVKAEAIQFNETAGRQFVVEFFNQGQKLTSLVGYLEDIIAQESKSTETIELDVKKKMHDGVKDGIIEITTMLPSGLNKKVVAMILKRIEQDRIIHQATKDALSSTSKIEYSPALMRVLQTAI